MVTLKSKLPFMRHYELDHASCCQGECCCSPTKHAVVATNPRTGERGYKIVQSKAAQTVTLAAIGTDGSIVSGLPDSVACATQILAARGRGDLDIIKE